MSAESHLASLGISIQEAHDFIFSHVDQPSIIFNLAQQYHVTTLMLSEITGYPTSVVNDYFASFGLNTTRLDALSVLLTYDIGSFAHFFDFDNRADILSTSSLKQGVITLLRDSTDYYRTFDSELFFEADDGIYTSNELGATHLGDHPATPEVLESLFFGTLINIGLAIDDTELQQLTVFTHNENNNNEYQAFLADILNDISPSPSTDDVLAHHVIYYAAGLIEEYWNTPSIYSVLDHSLLGLAVA